MNPWWTEATAGWVGAFAGGGLGALAGIYGAAAGCLAPRGKCRGLMLSVHVTLIVLGVVALGVGGVALAMKQPYHVYYPLLMIGFVLTIVMGCLFPVIRMRYRQAEIRKLDAAAIRGA